MATCDDCVLWSEPQPGDEGRCRYHTLRNAEAEEMRDWHVLHGDIREDLSISQEIVEFIQDHGALSVVMTDGIIGCPHQEGIDYHGEWCPVCEFWRGRDRFTGQMLD